MDFIIVAFKDLIKYKITASTNTGDRITDGLVSTLLVAIVTLVFMDDYRKMFFEYFKWIKNLIKRWLYHRVGKKTPLESIEQLTKENYAQYMEWFDASTLTSYMKVTWLIGENSIFHIQIGKWVNNLLNTDTQWVQFTESEVRLKTDRISVTLKEQKKIYPIFIDSGGKPIGMIQDNTGLALLVASINSLTELKNFLHNMDQPPVEEKAVDKNLYIKYAEDPKKLQLIYPDRNFDNYVSKYKKTLMAHIDHFKAANNGGKSRLNGFGSYNLGIMLHGLPGTGKTLFIKSLCNYLKRSALIVNMRTIKTTRDFEDLFTGWNITSNVYVFEEFDCVKSVIDRGTETIDSGDNEKEVLNKKLLSLLEMTAKHEKPNESLVKEIENVYSEIDKLKNKLSLDTMLTSLDGVYEMRGRVIIATTNFIDRIDKALMRPGRFDLKIKLEEYTSDECRELLELVFKNSASDEELASLSSVNFKEGVYTPVALLNICQEYGNLTRVIEVTRAVTR